MRKGFTLLEILLVIGAIGILAAIVIIAINPNQQLAQARNAERQSELNALLKAAEQYLIDRGQYPQSIQNLNENEGREVCATGDLEESDGLGSINCTSLLDLRNFVPTYISSIPSDPQVSGNSTGYTLYKVNNRVSLVASNSELNSYIGVGLSEAEYQALTPSAPEAVTDLSFIINGQNIDLSWTEPGDGGFPITDYIVEYSENGFGTFTSIVIGSGAGTSSYSLTNLPPSQYSVRIRAVNSEGTGESSNVIVALNTTIDLAKVFAGDLVIGPGGNLPSGTTMSGIYQVEGAFRILSGSNIVVENNPSTSAPWTAEQLVILAESIEIEGDINGQSSGYNGGYDGNTSDNGFGPGGGGGIYNTTDRQNGGGHGGFGGRASGNFARGAVYGSITSPTEPGSGGAGVRPNSAGGAGGGAVKLVTSGQASVNGTIDMDGGSGTNLYGAGGSGGSVWIVASELLGNGTISANGGNKSTDDGSGGGSGGRIALEVGVQNFNGSISANSGIGFRYGGGGTIFTRTSSMPNGELRVAQSSASETSREETPIQSDYISQSELDGLVFEENQTVHLNDSLTFHNTSLTVPLNASVLFNSPLTFSSLNETTILGTLDIEENTSSNLGNLIVGNGTDIALLTHRAQPTGNTKVSYIDMIVDSLTLRSNAQINVSEKGYQGGYNGNTSDNGFGPGGGGGVYNSTNRQNGGGYGGVGGRALSHNSPGSSYGNRNQPTDLGSGGAGVRPNSAGGNGGGAIEITSSGDITVNGVISANGGSGTNANGAGGAGGSIWLKSAGTLSGNGSILANGGDRSTDPDIGGGAGGRIALEFVNNTFSGPVTATRGVGWNDLAQNGTVCQNGCP